MSTNRAELTRRSVTSAVCGYNSLDTSRRDRSCVHKYYNNYTIHCSNGSRDRVCPCICESVEEGFGGKGAVSVKNIKNLAY